MLEADLIAEGEGSCPGEVVDGVVIGAAFEGAEGDGEGLAVVDSIGESDSEVDGASLGSGEGVDVDEEGCVGGEAFFSEQVEEGYESGIALGLGDGGGRHADFGVS